VADTDLATTAAVPADAEIGSLARRLAQAYASLVASRRELFKEGAEEATRRVRAEGDPEWQRRALSEPADEVSWWSLTLLIEADPEVAGGVWDHVKQEARAELESGHRAALALLRAARLSPDETPNAEAASS
jgi:hypothetical protein